MKDCHDLHLKVDVSFLPLALKTFRKESINFFDLDLAHSLSTSGCSWDEMLRFINANLKLISDIKKYQFVESALGRCFYDL